MASRDNLHSNWLLALARAPMIHSFSPFATAVGAGIRKAIAPVRSSTKQISQVGSVPKRGALSVVRIRTGVESRRVQNPRPNISPAALSPASVSLRYRLNNLEPRLFVLRDALAWVRVSHFTNL